ncbi:MAG: 30S ribosomal protein S7 [Deltaproteobacteria bacterium]|nr:MAG: 30S ribosomal protein S7 [Deltaproteobacteria bacterium]
MPRKGAVTKRDISPDPKYNDKLIAKLICYLQRRGKKSLAELIVYRTFDLIEQKTGEESEKVFKKALENVKPILETKSRRVGGATYQVPVEVRAKRRVALGLRWLVSYARMRGEKTMVEKLAGEILDAANNKGSAIKKKEDVHKMAEANKAFAHYRW